MTTSRRKKSLPSKKFWTGKRILITGHTGFKGSWLTLWLASMGAKVYGMSLDPPTTPNLFTLAGISGILESDTRCDIVDTRPVRNAFSRIKPEIVFHMAAQSLVTESYRNPSYTFSVNSLGTVNVLEAVRHAESVRAAVMVTTDKVYSNRETSHPYCENDALGGNDPYSASKACAEIIINSYRRSFLANDKKSISSARAGNVLGGGDWAENRLIPDAIKAFTSGKALILRNPLSVRPWQYILDVLSGYLMLAEAQYREPGKFACPWNFAPCRDCATTVETTANAAARLWGEGATVRPIRTRNITAEAGLLMLNPSKASRELGWTSRYSLQKTLRKTIDWYKAWKDNRNMHEFSLYQIQDFIKAGGGGK